MKRRCFRPEQLSWTDQVLNVIERVVENIIRETVNIDDFLMNFILR